MEFFRKDNFQRKYLFEVPRLLWQLERLNEIGDYLLLFPNPDYKSLEPTQPNGLNYQKASQYFNTIFETPYTYPYKQVFMRNLLASFEWAFLQMEEFTTPEEAAKRRQNL
jgi:hypothetical protein